MTIVIFGTASVLTRQKFPNELEPDGLKIACFAGTTGFPFLFLGARPGLSRCHPLIP